MNMTFMAARWLRFEKGCLFLLQERSPREWHCGRPDLIGITKARYVVEIEEKRSVSDFRNDKNKRSRENRANHLQMMPRQFYYLMPGSIADKVAGEIPEWAGLMSYDMGEKGSRYSYGINVRKPAPVNQKSRRLSVKEAMHCVYLMANQTLSSMESTHQARGQLRDRGILCDETWRIEFLPKGVNDYQI